MIFRPFQIKANVVKYTRLVVMRQIAMSLYNSIPKEICSHNQINMFPQWYTKCEIMLLYLQTNRAKE